MLDIHAKVALAAKKIMAGPVVEQAEDDSYELFGQFTMKRLSDGTINVSNRYLAGAPFGDEERLGYALYRLVLAHTLGPDEASPNKAIKPRNEELLGWFLDAAEDVQEAFYDLIDEKLDHVHNVCNNRSGMGPLTIGTYNRIVVLWGSKGEGKLQDLLPTHWPAVMLLNRMNSLTRKKSYDYPIEKVREFPASIEDSIFKDQHLWPELSRIHPAYIEQFGDQLAYGIMKHPLAKEVDVANVVMRIKRAPNCATHLLFEHGWDGELGRWVKEEPILEGEHIIEKAFVFGDEAIEEIVRNKVAEMHKRLYIEMTPESGTPGIAEAPERALMKLLRSVEKVDIAIGKNAIVFKNFKGVRK